jgi:hypothetical protein
VGRSINPITKGDWEGAGVKPDVAIAADKALSKANALALRQMLPNVDPRERSVLEKTRRAWKRLCKLAEYVVADLQPRARRARGKCRARRGLVATAVRDRPV